MEFSIIMPAYNEESTILDAVQACVDAKLPVGEFEVIVVENGSLDRTREVLRSKSWPPNVKIIEVDVNEGKGAGLKVGVAAASGTWMAVMDADMEYDPNDYAQMLPPLLAGQMDAALGTRHWQSHSAYNYWYVQGNRVINTMANILYNVYLSDCMVGMKVCSVDMWKSMELEEKGFGFDAEWVAKLLRRGARVYETPVTYHARHRAEGKKLTWKDGIVMVRVFVKNRFARVPA